MPKRQEMSQKIQTALISVYHKEGLEEILQELNNLRIKFISTGGTKEFIQSLGYECEAVEDVSGYPSILGGRVKTLHPKIFGGILYRRDNESDKKQVKSYDIPSIDLVIVDLYPFEETVAAGGAEDEIIEKIDIGGISLIRGAAKNYKDVLIVASKNQYKPLLDLLKEKQGVTALKTVAGLQKKLLKSLRVTIQPYSTILMEKNARHSVCLLMRANSSVMERIPIRKEYSTVILRKYSNNCMAKKYPTTTFSILMRRFP